MALIYFALMLLFGFLPGIINDLRLVRAVPWDSLGLSVALCYFLHDCAVPFRSAPYVRNPVQLLLPVLECC